MGAPGVRCARAADADAIADVQLRIWQDAYTRILPATTLAALQATNPRQRWRDELAAPTARRRDLVALDASTVVGFATAGPPEPPDGEPDHVAALYGLGVLPVAHRMGHGRRLLGELTAALRQEGFAAAFSWVFATDVATAAFLESAGWRADGADRELDLGGPVRQLRLATELAGRDVPVDLRPGAARR